jgi:hypothetical protein
VAPVLRALRRRLPDLALTLRTAIPAQRLARRLEAPFDLLPGEVDVGMRMASALAVRREDSARAYAELHRDWPARVAEEAAVVAATRADLVLADVPYLTLAAAQRAGVPAVALCSLNWADIYRAYLGERPEAPAILEQMLDAYATAHAFLRPQPSMPMPDIPNGRPIGPVADLGRDCREAVRAELGLAPGERLLLAALGGVDHPLPMARWPRLPGWRHLLPGDWIAAAGEPPREDLLAIEPLGRTVPDLMTAVDAVLTKPGYGTFVEAACLGLPVLYLRRPDWPEEPALTTWIHRHTRALEVNPGAVEEGAFLGELDRLLDRPAPPRATPDGVDQAADYLAGLLAG